MGNCAACGEITQLYVDGHPLCRQCEEKRNSIDALWEKVKTAKAEHQMLSRRFDNLNQEVVSGSRGIPYPDSVHSIESLGSMVRYAFQQYHRAMAAYAEAIKKR